MCQRARLTMLQYVMAATATSSPLPSSDPHTNHARGSAIMPAHTCSQAAGFQFAPCLLWCVLDCDPWPAQPWTDALNIASMQRLGCTMSPSHLAFARKRALLQGRCCSCCCKQLLTVKLHCAECWGCTIASLLAGRLSQLCLMLPEMHSTATA